MPEYTVRWKAKADGECTIEADDEDAAKEQVLLTGWGMEIANVNELSEFEVEEVEWFQGGGEQA